MARSLLTGDAHALAAFKEFCAGRHFGRALNWLKDHGVTRDTPNTSARETGGFYLTAAACEGDADLEAFRNWVRGNVGDIDGLPRLLPVTAPCGELPGDWSP